MLLQGAPSPSLAPGADANGCPATPRLAQRLPGPGCRARSRQRAAPHKASARRRGDDQVEFDDEESGPPSFSNVQGLASRALGTALGLLDRLTDLVYDYVPSSVERSTARAWPLLVCSLFRVDLIVKAVAGVAAVSVVVSLFQTALTVAAVGLGGFLLYTVLQSQQDGGGGGGGGRRGSGRGGRRRPQLPARASNNPDLADVFYAGDPAAERGRGGPGPLGRERRYPRERRRQEYWVDS